MSNCFVHSKTREFFGGSFIISTMIQVIHPSCNFAGKNHMKAVIPTCLYKAVCFGGGGSF